MEIPGHEPEITIQQQWTHLGRISGPKVCHRRCGFGIGLAPDQSTDVLQGGRRRGGNGGLEYFNSNLSFEEVIENETIDYS
ncbi:MAG: hypothetical protein ABT940_12805, partial [Alphaproteobacteria bacterium]